MSPTPTKDTIYIDVDDEITAIIDKVRGSDAKVVALVLPKRATTLQSIVNLKLLKRTSSEAKKSLVLITSEPSLLPIAGAVGLHVAKTLQTKPEVPPIPTRAKETSTAEVEAPEPALDPHASIGQLAGHVATEETIELDNDADIAEPAAGASADKIGSKLSKKLKIPDFDRFRLLLFGGIGLLILLIVGGVFAFVILPKAQIIIKTDTASVSTDLAITAKTDAKEVDAANLIVPALRKELKKTENEKVPATGQKNVGEKAKGTVKIYNCNKDDKLSDTVRTVPAGSSVASGGSVFVLTTAVDVEPSSFVGNTCSRNKASDSVGVVAQNSGDQYNLSARTYTVSGFPSMDADGSNMSGGTSKLVQVVSQTDIDNAKQKVLDRISAAAAGELVALFTTDNALALTDTFAAGAPAVAATPNVNDTATDVTVSVTVTFSEFGAKLDDLKQLVEADASKRIDTSKQTISDNGLSKAVVQITDKSVPTIVKFRLQTIVIAGPQLDAEGIKKEIAGKKKSVTQSLIQSRPGIKDVTVNYSPVWVFSTPKKTSHITIIFDQNNATD